MRRRGFEFRVPRSGFPPNVERGARNSQLLQAVQRLGIVVKNFVDNSGLDLALLLELTQGFDFGRGIGVTIVRADYDIVLSGVFQNIGQIIVGLASDIDAIVADDIPYHAPVVSLKPLGELNDHIGHPLCSDLDKTKPQFGKFLRYAVMDDGVAGRKHRDLEARESALPFEQLPPVEISRGSMNAKRQIRFFRCLVKWEEKWMAEALVVN